MIFLLFCMLSIPESFFMYNFILQSIGKYHIANCMRLHCKIINFMEAFTFYIAHRIQHFLHNPKKDKEKITKQEVCES